MLDINLLGTGGMVPLPGRFLTALMIRCRGAAILIDCGEGTQVAIRAAGLGFKQIGVIALTHFHADHIAGLPGLLLTIGNSGRTEPLTIVGPQYVGQIVDCLRVIAPQLPYPIEYREIMSDGPVWADGPLSLSVQAVEHWIPCYAYKVSLARSAKFNADKARELNIPVRSWSVLQSGAAVEVDGRIINPGAVMGPARKGLEVCYATDLRPGEGLVRFAENADLFICEGMYGDPELYEKAVEHRHCLFTEAADMAARAGVSALWLTHFSPSMPDPENYLPQARAVFANTFIDQTGVTLRFQDA
ncbi:MAG: ribonuclease Z [Oscillospiraceae bacterium]|nr:ribonuclease Z [Oscillospiraceae bacterium]